MVVRSTACTRFWDLLFLYGDFEISRAENKPLIFMISNCFSLALHELLLWSLPLGMIILVFQYTIDGKSFIPRTSSDLASKAIWVTGNKILYLNWYILRFRFIPLLFVSLHPFTIKSIVYMIKYGEATAPATSSEPYSSLGRNKACLLWFWSLFHVPQLWWGGYS